uniref:Uncharacterized protein n=1 Tax=Rousettus aegyptiacus TaxID=9407 RepID=A0A7J8G9V5_ROUAE|nr:hypothetical protein HJG63_011501 [Rousettus aegyptiacus]
MPPARCGLDQLQLKGLSAFSLKQPSECQADPKPISRGSTQTTSLNLQLPWSPLAPQHCSCLWAAETISRWWWSPTKYPRPSSPLRFCGEMEAKRRCLCVFSLLAALPLMPLALRQKSTQGLPMGARWPGR